MGIKNDRPKGGENYSATSIEADKLDLMIRLINEFIVNQEVS